MSTPSDPDLSASQHIDQMLRRVLFPLLASGLLGLLAVWLMESLDGTLTAFNRFAYPVIALTCLTSLVCLWRWPRLLTAVRWAGFLGVTLMLLAEVVMEVRQPTSMIGSYNAITLTNWLPLCYALAFFMLEARQAYWAAALMLTFVTAAGLYRGSLALPFAAEDRALLLNTVVSQFVLVVCLTGLLWLKRVVAEQGEQTHRLRELAGTDPLTGLANRRQTLRLLDTLVAERPLGAAPALLLGDLDLFKAINDDCGHEVGDQVLVEVGAVLRRNTRDSDTVARWGGEEFLIVLPRTRPGEAAELAERLRHCVQSMSLADRQGRPLTVTISVGLATIRANEPVSAWLRRADEALYRAKRAGRNCCIDGDIDAEAQAPEAEKPVPA